MIRIFILCFTILATHSFGQNKDLGLQFILKEKDIEGKMLIYDLEENEYFTNSKRNIRSRRLPGTMFHLFNTLMFYQLGIVKDSTQALTWDGEIHYFDDYEVPVWNKDTYLAEAFKNGTDWYFTELSQHIDHKIYKKSIKKSKYGAVGSTRLNDLDFWNGGAGKVMIDMKDYIKFLRRFRDYKLPFEKKHINQVKELMIEKKTSELTLYGKVGLSKVLNLFFDGGDDIGWYSGYVETKENTYFFVSYISKDFEDEREDFFELRRSVVFKAFKHLFNVDLQ